MNNLEWLYENGECKYDPDCGRYERKWFEEEYEVEEEYEECIEPDSCDEIEHDARHGLYNFQSLTNGQKIVLATVIWCNIVIILGFAVLGLVLNMPITIVPIIIIAVAIVTEIRKMMQ